MKANWPKPHKEFAIPLYGGRVYVFTGKKKVALARTYLKLPPRDKGREYGFCEHSVHSETGDSLYLIGWFNGKWDTLAHEIAHACFFSLAYAGIDVRESAGEAFCYLLSDLLCKAGIDK